MWSEVKRDRFWELRDMLSKGILEDLKEIKVKANGVERKLIALLCYKGGKRYIAEMDGNWVIVEDGSIIASMNPLDVIAFGRIGEEIPEYNQKLCLYKKIASAVKDED